MAALGLKEGEWFIDSKARAKRAMTSEFFSPAARIHICLGLATMGFQQELAVKMVGGKIVPKTPADVCAETHIKRENFRRHMAELAAMGLAECRGSTKGRVELYSWLVPRPVDVKRIVIARDDNFSGYPPDLVPLLKHYRIRLPDGKLIARDDILELERLARATIQAEKSLRAYADRLRARAGLNKEERNRKEPSKETGPPPQNDTVKPPPPAKAEEEVAPALQPEVLPPATMADVPPADPPTYATLKRLYPTDHFDEPKTKPLFEAMTPVRKAQVIARLRVYLSCERWTGDQGRFVPLSSNWLPSCDADPPPAVRLRRKHDQKLDDKAESLKQTLACAQAFSRRAGG